MIKRKIACTALCLVIFLLMAFPAGANASPLTIHRTELQWIEQAIYDMEQLMVGRLPTGISLDNRMVYSRLDRESTGSVLQEIYILYFDRPVIENGARMICNLIQRNKNTGEILEFRNGTGIYVNVFSTSAATLITATTPASYAVANVYSGVRGGYQTVVGYMKNHQTYEEGHSFRQIITDMTTVDINDDGFESGTLKAGLIPYGTVFAPVPPVNSAALRSLLVTADVITDIGYTPPTWTRFETARYDGHAVISLEPNYTQLQVNAAYTELDGSMQGLTLSSVIPPYVPPGGGGYTPPIGGAFDPSGKNLMTGEIMGYLLPAYRIFIGYVISVNPIFIVLLTIMVGVWILPIAIGRIFKRLGR